MTGSPNFRSLVKEAAEGLVLKPLLHVYLYEGKFPQRFNVPFYKAGEAREPDGWFHPSSHPLLEPMQLYQYLTNPQAWASERLSYEGRMSVTMGTAIHAFIEMCIRDGGWMAELTGTCPACQRPQGLKKGQCGEFGAADPILKRRGHMDGKLTLPQWGIGGFEFKTTSVRDMDSLKDNDLEMFRKKWLPYYAQVQEYMDITGLRQFIVLFLGMGYPWRLLEFQVPYDAAFASEVRDKYALVRRHEQNGTLPLACCAPRSKKMKQCPAMACHVKRI